MAVQPRTLLDTEIQLELFEWLDVRIRDRIQFERELDPDQTRLPDHLARIQDAAIAEAMCPQRPMRYGVDIGGPMPEPWSFPRFQGPFIGPLPYPAMPPIRIPEPAEPLTSAELAQFPPHSEAIAKMRPEKPPQEYFDNLELSEGAEFSPTTFQGKFYKKYFLLLFERCGTRNIFPGF